jgi:tetratricopeptide (TPR) repeat protein
MTNDARISSIGSLCARGENELVVGNLRDAEGDFRRAIELCTSHVPAWNGLGRCYQYTGKPGQALHCFDNALVHDPGHLPSRFGRAVNLTDLGRLQEARETYLELLQAAPEHAILHNNFGTVLDAMQEISGAGRCYEEATRLDPRYATAWVNLAGLKTRQNRVDEAREFYARAVALDPADPVKAMLHDFQCSAFYTDSSEIEPGGPNT